MGTTHLALAACLYLGLRTIGIDVSVDLVFMAVLIGSVFPDIDHPRSSIAQQSYLMKGISRAVFILSEHRGVVHSLLASLLLTAFLYSLLAEAGLGGTIALGFLFGYLTHLVGDSMTKGGVRWLQPFSDRKLRGPLRTGARSEELLFVVLLALLFYELLLFR